MKAITKQQVSTKLEKYNNSKEVAKMIEKNFDYAVSKYSTLKSICECIVTLN